MIKTILFHRYLKAVTLLIIYFVISISFLTAQTPDTAKKRTSPNAALIEEDTANFLDKFMIAELEKVQYSRYSDSLKKQTLEELVKNQKLQNISLEQKLQNQQLKAESDKKQADADLAKVEATRVKAEAERQQELQNQKIIQLQNNELQQRLTLESRTRNFLYIGLAFLGLFGLSLLRSNRQLKNRNKAIQKLSEDNLHKEQEKQQILATQNDTLELQVHERTNDLEISLKELKETQTQLIQREKMASLGELTAGIAHEIQNPLNFVNNFSELSVDLAKELNEEIGKLEIPEKDKAYVGEILADLSSNQEKINHHGKRASNIVKGMLEHSRTSTGVKELMDINRLVDESIRLTYHGLRAKDKGFNADFTMDLADNLDKIKVVSQDLGRVFINLFNNAFYAVHQKKMQNTVRMDSFGEGGYQPLVSVSTHKTDKGIEIRVTDNGNGIPENIKQKVFQPFFTTKPTGEGTGLGLSLSYDIVVKGHSGALEIETKEGEFTTFIIKLP